MNKAIIQGNISTNIKYNRNKKEKEKSYARFNVAVNNKENVTFLPCVAFGNTAEFINNYFDKGNKILIEGRMSYNSEKDDEGNWSNYFSIIVEKAYFCERKSE